MALINFIILKTRLELVYLENIPNTHILLLILMKCRFKWMNFNVCKLHFNKSDRKHTKKNVIGGFESRALLLFKISQESIPHHKNSIYNC